MSKADFERRTRALEARHHADLGNDEAARLRLFLDKLTDDELRQYGAICERTQDGTLPLTAKEQSCLDEMERKYSTFGNIERYEAYFNGDDVDLSESEKVKLKEYDRYFEDLK